MKAVYVAAFLGVSGTILIADLGAKSGEPMTAFHAWFILMAAIGLFLFENHMGEKWYRDLDSLQDRYIKHLKEDCRQQAERN